jgi:hypothetical protein
MEITHLPCCCCLEVVLLMVVTMAPVSESSSKTPSPRPFFGYCLRFVGVRERTPKYASHASRSPGTELFGWRKVDWETRTLQLLMTPLRLTTGRFISYFVNESSRHQEFTMLLCKRIESRRLSESGQDGKLQRAVCSGCMLSAARTVKS